MNLETIIQDIRKYAEVVDQFKLNPGNQIASLTATVDEEPGACQAIITNDRIEILYTSEESFKSLKTDKTIVEWCYRLTIEYNGDTVRNAHLHYESRHGYSNLNSALNFDIEFDTDVKQALERLNRLSSGNSDCTINNQIHFEFE